MVNHPLFTQFLYKVKVYDIFSGGYKVATKEPLAWSLCHNKEMNSNTYTYCDKRYENTYPCVFGAAYYG